MNKPLLCTSTGFYHYCGICNVEIRIRAGNQRMLWKGESLFWYMVPSRSDWKKAQWIAHDLMERGYPPYNAMSDAYFFLQADGKGISTFRSLILYTLMSLYRKKQCLHRSK